MLVKQTDNKVFTCPIAGTRKRGKDAEEDQLLKDDLLQDEKERAEHVMLVDLARNDMGRIAEFGTVKVTQFMEVQNYSHVMHIVSLVEGRKKGERHPLDLVASFLPAGTLSGAPKIRAMEIIEELETVRRGLYGGVYQYFGTFTSDINVVRNDKITIEEIEQMDPEKLVLSPGPKAPKDAGICMEAVTYFLDKKPILGICLGHQCIGEALGGTVSYAKAVFHGKQSKIEHDGTGIFYGINSPIKVARYHSLAVLEKDLPECLKIIAKTADGEIMAIRHKEYPVVGLQFHPESIYTEHGKRLIENFVNDVI